MVTRSSWNFCKLQFTQGFLRVTSITNASGFGFERYESYKYLNSLSLILTGIPIVDGRYAIIYANSTDFEVTSIITQEFININCDVYVGIGQVCIVTGEYIIQTNPIIEDYAIRLLSYEGYLLSEIGRIDGQIVITGYVFNDDGEVYSWNLPKIVE
ncbi:15902_t:CDS:2 [Funneliformis mosseae]|uniref:15902_t:CDS:1 n=1 Tax=Funneliformis mosseae TaxID=27381 RepID=A0A9N9GQF9_FUNMO|nr:15902_t:CDS:2 [Funneliformis mosseae]